MPHHKIVFTGHSLGGAIASIASTVFVRNFPEMAARTFSITFGQPRVGNLEYAITHDKFVAAGSWRVIHGRDIVAHIPFCVESYSRSCIPFYNHGSYHHGVEVWFPGNMTNQDTFRVCTGSPLNEDNSCRCEQKKNRVMRMNKEQTENFQQCASLFRHQRSPILLWPPCLGLRCERLYRSTG